MPLLNTSRHDVIFSPLKFGNRRIDVIGAGAAGSHVVMALAKLGIRNIHVHDHDHVGSHNVPNQVFGLADIGKLKVDAAAEAVLAATGIKITVHPEKVTAQTPIAGEFVFLLTDSMTSRREIWEGCIRLKPNIRLMIETRMGVDNYRVYTVNPNSPIEGKAWEKTLVAPGKKVFASACGAEISVGPTAHMLAGQAVWQLIRYVQLETQDGLELVNEIIVGINPPLMLSRSFHEQ